MFKASQLYTNFRKLKKCQFYSKFMKKIDFSQNRRKIWISVKKSWKLISVFMFGKSIFHRNFQNSFENLDLTQNVQKMSKIFDLSKIFRQIKILVDIVQNLDFSKIFKESWKIPIS